MIPRRSRRDVLRLAGVVGLGSLLAACSVPAPSAGGAQSTASDQPRYGGVLINNACTTDPPTLDVQRESTFNVVRPVGPAYDLLVRYDPMDPDSIIPDLAEAWDVASDGKTVTFHLRKGVMFHSGHPFTSADAKFSIDRIRGAITQGPGALPNAPRKDLLRAIDRVDTPDDATAVLHMAYPQASFFGFMANQLNAPMYSKQWIEAGHDPAKEVNGTGPFKFKEYIPGTSIELVKNDKYWNQGRPYLDGVKTYIVPDANTVVASLRTGQMMFTTLNPVQAAPLKADIESGAIKNLEVLEVPPGLTSAHLYMNTTVAPFNDARVRKAVTLAVDRSELVKLRGETGVSNVSGWLIPGTFWALPPDELAKIPGYGPNKEQERAQARQLLADAGYPNGLSMKMPTRNTPDAALLWADQLAKVGIKLELEVLVDAALDPRLMNHDFQIAQRGAFAGTTEDPDTFYGQFLTCGAPRNYSGWCDQKFQDMFSQQSQTLDREARRKIVWDIERYVLEQAPTLPAGSSSSMIWIKNKAMNGWRPHYQEYNHSRLDTVWLS